MTILNPLTIEGGFLHPSGSATASGVVIIYSNRVRDTTVVGHCSRSATLLLGQVYVYAY